MIHSKYLQSNLTEKGDTAKVEEWTVDGWHMLADDASALVSITQHFSNVQTSFALIRLCTLWA